MSKNDEPKPTPPVVLQSNQIVSYLRQWLIHIPEDAQALYSGSELNAVIEAYGAEHLARKQALAEEATIIPRTHNAPLEGDFTFSQHAILAALHHHYLYSAETDEALVVCDAIDQARFNLADHHTE